jgi:hypothetical protein
MERNQSRGKAPNINDYLGKSKKNLVLPLSENHLVEKHSNLSTIAIPTLLQSAANCTPNNYQEQQFHAKNRGMIKSTGQMIRG